MNSISDVYERWFSEGNHDVRDFLSGRTLTDDEFRNCILTDQFLHHQAGMPINTSSYAELLPRVAGDDELQTELWLEAFGYLEEKGEISESTLLEFLNGIPKSLRDTVEQQTACDTADFATVSWDTPPSVPRYRIEQEIGRGAFGVVYRAWDKQLDRAVALKVVQQTQASDDLFAEARLVAKIDVPGIVSVYDCGIEAGGRSFFVTTFLEGPDLQEWSNSLGYGDWKRVCKLFIRLCKSLKVAHANGIVHRDIKPTNIIVREGDDPCLLDFGLALGKWEPGRKGELVGTPAYMSPEQARGEGHLVDARSDIFSVGILLIESLTGQRPWESRSSRELVREIAHGQVRSVRRINESIPLALERICSKATAATISQRYGRISELIEDLQWYVDNQQAGSTTNVRASSIASRGLRSYTADDSEDFWQLVPGQRNGRGVPDAIRWWLNAIEGKVANGPNRGVLVLYGPSGSGKSSLLHAGVLPFVESSATNCISLDASELSTPDLMTRHLATAAGVSADPEATPAPTLATLCATVRNTGTRRTVVVLDQFEQVLAWSDEPQRAEVAMAMRQADGDRLKFILVVRDEFWSAISRLMRDLDAPLRDGRNAMGLERFTRDHAGNVLQTWADAAGHHDLDDAFIARALTLIAENDRVIPVRLALLASILGDADWTIGRIDEVEAKGSLSGYYLDSVLGELAPSAKGRFASPARAVLRCLTPDSGRIRGPAKSIGELHEACRVSGQTLSESDFDDLVDLLDRQLHLLTPVDSIATSGQPSLITEAVALSRPSSNARSESIASTGTIALQLMHDFLVPEVRDWLDASDLKTARGRAAVDLRRATDRWANDAHSRNLAGPMDCLRFGIVTRPANVPQRAFVKASARKHLLRGLVTASVAIMLLAVFQFVMLRTNGNALVSRLVSSDLSRLPEVVAETRRHSLWTRRPLASRLAAAEKESDWAAKDRIALALLRGAPTHLDYLTRRLVEVESSSQMVILQHMSRDLNRSDLKTVIDRLAKIVSDDSQSGNARLKAAVGLGALDPAHSTWDIVRADVCQLLVDANPMDLGWLKDGLYPVRSQLRRGLTDIRAEEDAAKVRTATYLLAEFALDDFDALIDLLEHSALPQLSAIVPAVSAAETGILELLHRRFAERLESWQTARKKVDTPQNETNAPSQRAAMSSVHVHLARQVGNLGCALIWRGAGKNILEHLRFSEDPTIRNYLVECYASSQGPSKPLVDLLLDSPDAPTTIKDGLRADVAAALLQTLGSLPASSQVPRSISTLAETLYRNSDDRELQASAEWYLRKRGYEIDLANTIPHPNVGYVTSQGHMMVRLPGEVTATVGSSMLDRNRLANEERHEILIPKEIYFSRHELSAIQLQQFRQGQGRAMPRGATQANGSEAMRIGFFEAAAYCNWLNEKEGIPEDQWCYLPNSDGHLGPGMRIAENHLQRSGYQIPIPDFWEYACRGGTTTPRSYGYGTELSSGYVRWMGTRPGTRQRISIRKPNGFGLFDMLGNSSEWSVGLVDRTQMNAPGPPPGGFAPRLDGQGREPPRRGPPPGRNSRPGERMQGGVGLAFGGGPRLVEAAGEIVQQNSQFAILGGAFDSPAHKTRSSDRSMISPPFTNKPITLRLMRIVQ